MTPARLKRWEASEPDRLERRARDWEREAKIPGRRLAWLMNLATAARQAASNLRAMRSARMRQQSVNSE